MKKKVKVIGGIVLFLTITFVNVNVAVTKMNHTDITLELIKKAVAGESEIIDDPFPGYNKCWSGWMTTHGQTERYCGTCYVTMMRTVKRGYCYLW